MVTMSVQVVIQCTQQRHAHCTVRGRHGSIVGAAVVVLRAHSTKVLRTL